jgi:hypothetical protein
MNEVQQSAATRECQATTDLREFAGAHKLGDDGNASKAAYSRQKLRLAKRQQSRGRRTGRDGSQWENQWIAHTYPLRDSWAKGRMLSAISDPGAQFCPNRSYAVDMLEPVLKSPLDLRWASVLEGAEMAVLYGDPVQPGEPFVVRFRTDRQIDIPLHWHRTDEHITVLNGPLSLRDVDTKSTQLEEGSYLVIPAGVHHATRYGLGTVIQVRGIGPQETIYVDPAADPGKHSVAS